MKWQTKRVRMWRGDAIMQHENSDLPLAILYHHQFVRFFVIFSLINWNVSGGTFEKFALRRLGIFAVEYSIQIDCRWIFKIQLKINAFRYTAKNVLLTLNKHTINRQVSIYKNVRLRYRLRLQELLLQCKAM